MSSPWKTYSAVSSTPGEIHGQQTQPSPQLGISPAPAHPKRMDRAEHGKLMRIKNRKAILEPLILQSITRIKGDKNQRNYIYVHKSTLAKKTTPPEENHVLRCTETAGPERRNCNTQRTVSCHTRILCPRARGKEPPARAQPLPAPLQVLEPANDLRVQSSPPSQKSQHLFPRRAL